MEATRGESSPEEVSILKRGWVNMSASVLEHFRYFKASLYSLGKKMTAKSEKEAAEADLQTSKMQVEAADAAEDSKNKLYQ